MLNESRLYSFLDNSKGFTVHFIEGQKVIHDLVLLHDSLKSGFSFFRDTVLSTLHLMNYLKAGDNIGFYIDSDEPVFRYKIEINNQGTFRTLLMPKDFSKNPELISGKIRQTKISESSRTPYTSMTDFKKSNPLDLFNKFMHESYQTNSKVILSDNSDQSIMVAKLPEIQIDREKIIDDISLTEYITSIQKKLNEIFNKAYNNDQEIIREFESLNLLYLHSKELKFYCPCTKEQFAIHISSLDSADQEEIFMSGDAHVQCDYCSTEYNITKADLIGPQ